MQYIIVYYDIHIFQSHPSALNSEAPGHRPGRALLPTWPAAWVRVGDRRAAASAERRACGISPSKKVGFTTEHGDLLTCFSMRKEDL